MLQREVEPPYSLPLLLPLKLHIGSQKHMHCFLHNCFPFQICPDSYEEETMEYYYPLGSDSPRDGTMSKM